MYVHLLSRLKRAFCVVPLFLTLLHTCTRRCQGEASSLFLLPIQIIPVTIFRGHDVLCAEIPSCEWKRVDLHCGCCYCFKWGRLVLSLFFFQSRSDLGARSVSCLYVDGMNVFAEMKPILAKCVFGLESVHLRHLNRLYRVSWIHSNSTVFRLCNR